MEKYVLMTATSTPPTLSSAKGPMDITLPTEARRIRHTKIVCTIGPATSDLDILREMVLAGMNVVRLNFSHGAHEDHAKVVASGTHDELLRRSPHYRRIFARYEVELPPLEAEVQTA